ncbi:hypothetical protein OC861_006766 [Tilletia horrida]|nr:hypothetical protein OC845_006843 [Tilletia horrida]KAK0559034.1 hypothetical protein OC861_006766 [Tilletia horrida]
MRSSFDTKPLSTLDALLSRIPDDPSRARMTRFVSFVKAKCRIRFPRSPGLHNPKRLFLHPTNWNWILQQCGLHCSFEAYNITGSPDYLRVVATFEVRNVRINYPTRSRLQVQNAPWMSWTHQLHLLRAGHCLSNCRKRNRFILQGTILIIEWEDPVTAAPDEHGMFDPESFLRQVTSFTARVMVRGSIVPKARGHQYLIMAIETSAFLMHGPP